MEVRWSFTDTKQNKEKDTSCVYRLGTYASAIIYMASLINHSPYEISILYGIVCAPYVLETRPDCLLVCARHKHKS
jgi:hypothetical protein